MRRLLLVVSLWSAATVALADAIDGPPEDCPRGAYGESSHSGSWCASTTCTADADCSRYAYSPRGPVTLQCEPLGLCVVSESYVEGGMRAVDSPPRTLVREVARAACSTDADCSAPARCIVAPRCAEVAHPITGALAHACGCRASAPASGARGAVALVGLVALALARRRVAR